MPQELYAWFYAVANSLLVPIGPFYYHGLSLIPERKGNHMTSNVWDENYLSIPKLQRLHWLILGIDK